MSTPLLDVSQIPVQFERTRPFPLEKYTVFQSLAAAEAYANGPLAYVGQLITILTNGQPQLYQIQNDKSVLFLNVNGGSEGTTDYAALTNKPQINGITLNGNLTAEDLGIEGGGGGTTNITSTTLTVGGTPTDKTIDLTATQVNNLNKAATSLQPTNIVNNITTTTAGNVLDASQGKILNDRIDDIVSTGSSPTNITSTTLTVGGTGFNRTVDLSATQAANINAGGTALQPSNIANNLTTTTAGSILDATQGKVLDDKITDITDIYADVQPLALQSSTLRYLINAGYLTANFASRTSVSANTYNAVGETLTNIAQLQPFTYGINTFGITDVPSDVQSSDPYELQLIDFYQIHRLIFDFTANTITLKSWLISDLKAAPVETVIYDRDNSINTTYNFTNPAYLTYIDTNIYTLLQDVTFDIQVYSTKSIVPPVILDTQFTFNADGSGNVMLVYQNLVPLYQLTAANFTVIADLAPLASSINTDNTAYSIVNFTSTDKVIWVGVDVKDRFNGTFIVQLDLDEARLAEDNATKTDVDEAVTDGIDAHNADTATHSDIRASITTTNTNVSNITATAIPNAISAHNVSNLAHTDIRTSVNTLSTNTNTALGTKVNKSGDTMTGSLTLSGDPTTANMAATKAYVDDAIAAIPSGGLSFTGYLQPTQPTADIREGNYWLNVSLAAGAAPSTTFPWTVQQYTSGAWTAATYTPSSLDLWQDTVNNETWYYIGDEWERIDFNGSTFNTNQFTVNSNVVSLKAGGITNNEIAANANIAQSKIDGLTDSFASKADKVVPTNANNIAVLDTNGNLVDSGLSKQVLIGANKRPVFWPTKGVTAFGVSATAPQIYQTSLDLTGYYAYNIALTNNPVTYTVTSVTQDFTNGIPANIVNNSLFDTTYAALSTEQYAVGDTFDTTQYNALEYHLSAYGTYLDVLTVTYDDIMGTVPAYLIAYRPIGDAGPVTALQLTSYARNAIDLAVTAKQDESFVFFATEAEAAAYTGDKLAICPI